MTPSQLHELVLRLSVGGGIGFFFLWAILRALRDFKQNNLVTLHKGWDRFATGGGARSGPTINWKARWLPPTFVSDWKEAGFDRPSKTIWASGIACLLCIGIAYSMDRGWL